jgi:hypothetical protein
LLAVINSGSQDQVNAAFGCVQSLFLTMIALLDMHLACDISQYSLAVLTPCIIDMFEASSKEEDRMSRFIALILTVSFRRSARGVFSPLIQALHNRICAMSPSPAVFQVPWPLPARGVGVGSLSEEHVRAVTTHK